MKKNRKFCENLRFLRISGKRIFIRDKSPLEWTCGLEKKLEIRIKDKMNRKQPEYSRSVFSSCMHGHFTSANDCSTINGHHFNRWLNSFTGQIDRFSGSKLGTKRTLKQIFLSFLFFARIGLKAKSYCIDSLILTYRL